MHDNVNNRLASKDRVAETDIDAVAKCRKHKFKDRASSNCVSYFGLADRQKQ
jgi:hypothetical protein